MNIVKDQQLTFTFSTAIILTIILQSLGVVWWASKIQAQTDSNTASIQKITNTASINLTREQLDDILGSRDEQIKSLRESLDEFKTESRASFSRIENKLK